MLLFKDLNRSEKKYVDRMLEQASEKSENNSEWTKVIAALVRRWRDQDDTIEIPRIEEFVKSLENVKGLLATSSSNPEHRSQHYLFTGEDDDDTTIRLPPFDVNASFVKSVEESRSKVRAKKPKSSVVEDFMSRTRKSDATNKRNREERISSSSSSQDKITKKKKKKRRVMTMTTTTTSSNKGGILNRNKQTSKVLPLVFSSSAPNKSATKMLLEEKESEEGKKTKKKRHTGKILNVSMMLKQKQKQKELEKKKRLKEEKKKKKKEEAERKKMMKKKKKEKTLSTKKPPPPKTPASKSSHGVDPCNFSGRGDNVLATYDRKEILAFFQSKDSVNPFPNQGPVRKILLHKDFELNEHGHKVKRIKIWMKLNYATREWFLAKTSKKV